MVASFHKTQSKCKKSGGYLIIYGCYNGRLRGAQGTLSAQRALRGALCTSAPKIGAHSTSLLWPELRHVSERYLRSGNYLTAVNRPMEEQMEVSSRPMKALFKVEWIAKLPVGIHSCPQRSGSHVAWNGWP